MGRCGCWGWRAIVRVVWARGLTAGGPAIPTVPLPRPPLVALTHYALAWLPLLPVSPCCRWSNIVCAVRGSETEAEMNALTALRQQRAAHQAHEGRR